MKKWIYNVDTQRSLKNNKQTKKEYIYFIYTDFKNTNWAKSLTLVAEICSTDALPAELQVK